MTAPPTAPSPSPPPTAPPGPRVPNRTAKRMQVDPRPSPPPRSRPRSGLGKAEAATGPASAPGSEAGPPGPALLGRDAQPDIVYQGDRLRWAAHGARCRARHLAAQIRLAIGAIRRPHSPADWIAQDKRYIAQAWTARRAAQADARRYDRLLAAREAERMKQAGTMIGQGEAAAPRAGR